MMLANYKRDALFLKWRPQKKNSKSKTFLFNVIFFITGESEQITVGLASAWSKCSSTKAN